MSRRLLVATVLAWCATLLAAPPAIANPNPMTRDEIVAIGKTVVGFSYWWGGGAWLPGSASKGQCIPSGSSGCPNCTHKGSYGADCSGFVAKAWQIDKPVPLEKNYHPFSTWHFANQSTWWTKPPKGEAKRADAFNYNTNGAGHVWLFDKGDPWGSAYAWECKGCAYGCVYNLRSVSANYGLIRRKLITDPPACKAHCEGTVIVGNDCGKGDCAAYAAKCVEDSLGVRCVSAFCPAQGTTTTCLPDAKNGKIASCVDGQLKDPGDCSVYGALCSTAVSPKPACVSALCAGSPTVKPVAGDLCYDGKRFSCNAQGGIAESPCPPNQPCQTLAGKTGPGSGSCGPKPCGNCDDGNPCTDDGCSDGVCGHAANAASCNDGDKCTASDACSGGKCAGTQLSCDDGATCTADSCQAGTCLHAPVDAECDDGNPCTVDTCADKGCLHAIQDGPCEDGDGCTLGGGCKDGTCQAGSAKRCDDDNTCTADSCKDGTCLHDPLEGGCNDGDGCTVGDYCALGLCLSGASLACDDGLACTLDHCESGRCKHIGDLGQVLRTCNGPDVRVPPPCTGMTERTEPCPSDHPCVDGVCSPPATVDADGAGLADQALGYPGDTVTGTAAANASPSPASGCSASRTSAGANGAAALALFVLAGWLRRRRMFPARR